MSIAVVRNILGHLEKYLVPDVIKTRGALPRYFFKWPFLLSFTAVPLTLLSAHVCGSEGGKRIILTQGGRMLEGATPTDKQTIGLMTTTCGRNSGLINKAVAGIKGQTPMPTPKVGELA